jgi:hypothetical protein
LWLVAFATEGTIIFHAERPAMQGSPVQLIPRQIVMSFRRQAEMPPQIFELWHHLNPRWEIRFFDDAEALRFITQHFGARHASFFTALSGPKQGAYKV